MAFKKKYKNIKRECATSNAEVLVDEGIVAKIHRINNAGEFYQAEGNDECLPGEVTDLEALLNIDKDKKHSKLAIQHHVVMEFSKDPYLLKQYYHIREELYRKDLGLEDFSGEEDEYDIKGDILIVRVGMEVIGGARINYCNPGEYNKLVLEGDGFDIKKLFPHLQLEEYSYCEFSRLALKNEYRPGKVLRMMVYQLINHCKDKQVNYLFTVSPEIQAKVYKRICSTINVDFRLVRDIDVIPKPIYGGIKMVLSFALLTVINPKGMHK